MSATNITEDSSSKRTPRCTGCGTPLSEHQWGIASKFCEGQERSSPSKVTLHGCAELDEEIASLEDELAGLDLEEEKRLKQRRVLALQREIEEKRAKLHASSSDGETASVPGPSNIGDLKKLFAETPLDGILQPLNQQKLPVRHADGIPLAPRNTTWLETRSSEMFLKPAQLPKGEKALRIIDFVDNIVPREDEKTISDGGNTKLIVSYGPKKPKLEHVTLNQWVISNTRIFYNLLASQKLNTLEDIQHYLAYTVKVMELANRYQWVSILKYDEEFRLLQATYNYPWSFDSNHLHTVLLEPIPKAPINPRTPPRPGPSSNFVATTNEGRVICRSFNTVRGCNFNNCVYEHACNRRVAGGKACGLNHPGYSHHPPPNQNYNQPTQTHQHPRNTPHSPPQ